METISAWTVVAFLLLADGSASFYSGPSHGSYERCDQIARNLLNTIDFTADEIKIFAAECIPADRRHIPSEDQL